MKLRRLGMNLCLLTAGMFMGHAGNVPQAKFNPIAAGSAVAATYYPEVRLRKVHLVRPDLIFYPLDYEIFC